MSEVDPLTLARRIADELEAAGIPYAIGGALAYGYWGPPRGTQDVDVNLFVDSAQPATGLAALARAGVVFKMETTPAAIEAAGYLRGWVGRTPVDAFFNTIPLHEVAARRTCVRSLLGRPARILSAEDTVILKMLFHRSKDLVDVERLVALIGDQVDRNDIRSWLVDCVGDDDIRVLEWDEMVRTLVG